MTSSRPTQTQNPTVNSGNNTQDEIDLKEVLKALQRQPLWIGAGAAVGIAMATLSLLRTQPVYQGEFQILLDNKNSSSSMTRALANNPAFALLGANAAGGSGVATEIEILNSPSVLLPVFKAVQAKKSKEVAKGMNFASWRPGAVTIENTAGTSILNVKFRDTDKNIIGPITQLLSETYQKYSNRGRSRELSNMIKYLDKEIKKIKPIAKKSNREALEFGYAHGLGVRDGLPLAGSVSGASANSSGRGGYGGGGSIEAMRTAAQQEVMALKVQIQEAKRAGNGSIYFASQIANLTDSSSTFGKLTRIETELAEKRSRFKSNDPLIKRLERVRKTLIQYINQQTVALLKGELDLAVAKLQSFNRPKEIVSKHREITQQALRDEATLVNLQNQYHQVKLEQAREGDPWELISTPRVLDSPVSPNKKRTLALGLLTGLVFGVGGALVVDRRSGRVFSENQLEAFLPGHRLQTITSTEREQLTRSVELLANGPLKQFSSIAVVPVGSIKQSLLNEFCSALEQNLKQKQVLINNDLRLTKRCEIQVLIASPGASTRGELKELREQLSLQNTPVAGWILLNPKVSAA